LNTSGCCEAIRLAAGKQPLKIVAIVVGESI
ncbi:hypothetical protein P3T43_007098, partial [Paraburkholderia sp. GAS41]